LELRRVTRFIVFSLFLLFGKDSPENKSKNQNSGADENPDGKWGIAGANRIFERSRKAGRAAGNVRRQREYWIENWAKKNNSVFHRVFAIKNKQK